jgi:SAM-dependent methyltransferase
MADWISYWDSDNPIYVSARHRDVHARLVGEGILRYIGAPGMTVLDYGCAEARYADAIAARTGRLLLCEAAPNVRARLAARFAGNQDIAVLSPEDAAAMPDRSADLVVLHSVAQYLAPAEADAIFALFRRLLKPDGRLVVGDVIPPDVGLATDAAALLRLAAREGFFTAAVLGLVRTALSGYWKLRQQGGLTHYDERAMTAKLQAAGFAAARELKNIGHNQARMTFLARPA